jgi:hypothetical protein
MVAAENVQHAWSLSPKYFLELWNVKKILKHFPVFLCNIYLLFKVKLLPEQKEKKAQFLIASTRKVCAFFRLYIRRKKWKS